ncbi:MAG: hypothetical protein ABIX28_25870 [Vicinamibacterales bacterium]
MRRSRALIAASSMIIAAAMAPEAASAQAKPPPFVGKTWMATDPSPAPGTFRIFLADGTLVMDSCGETYRLASWRSVGPQRVEWREDTERIEAEVSQPSPNRLRLRLRLRDGGRKDEQYQLAKVPYVCPETRSSLPAGSLSGATTSARSPALVTPAPAAYRCGDETFKVAFDANQAFVTLPDGSLATLKRLTGGVATRGLQFTNGRLTFFLDDSAATTSQVTLARGRMAPLPCSVQK